MSARPPVLTEGCPEPQGHSSAADDTRCQQHGRVAAVRAPLQGLAYGTQVNGGAASRAFLADDSSNVSASIQTVPESHTAQSRAASLLWLGLETRSCALPVPRGKAEGAEGPSAARDPCLGNHC